MKQYLGRLITRLTLTSLQRMSAATWQSLVLQSLPDHLAKLPPKEALRLLFRLENEIYEWEGQQAIRYGQGVHSKHRHTRYADFFIAHLTPGQRVLDIGSGIGKVAYELASRAEVQVYGLEINPQSVATAQERHAHPHIQYVVGDALGDLTGTIPPPFDVILLSNVLEHLPQRPQLLQRLATFAKPQTVLIRVPLFERDWRVPLKQEVGIEWRLDPTHEIEYTLESFKDEMAQAGLTITHLEVRWGEIWSVLTPQ